MLRYLCRANSKTHHDGNKSPKHCRAHSERCVCENSSRQILSGKSPTSCADGSQARHAAALGGQSRKRTHVEPQPHSTGRKQTSDDRVCLKSLALGALIHRLTFCVHVLDAELHRTPVWYLRRSFHPLATRVFRNFCKHRYKIGRERRFFLPFSNFICTTHPARQLPFLAPFAACG